MVWGSTNEYFAFTSFYDENTTNYHQDLCRWTFYNPALTDIEKLRKICDIELKMDKHYEGCTVKDKRETMLTFKYWSKKITDKIIEEYGYRHKRGNRSR